MTEQKVIKKDYGKYFEEVLANSVQKQLPDNCYIRLRDLPKAFLKGGFSGHKQDCDFLLFAKQHLFFLELKSTKHKSLPLSNIKEHQIESLLKQSTKENVEAGLLIEFRTETVITKKNKVIKKGYDEDDNEFEYESTVDYEMVNITSDVYYLSIENLQEFIKESGRKSIPQDYLQEKGIKVRKKSKKVLMLQEFLEEFFERKVETN